MEIESKIIDGVTFVKITNSNGLEVVLSEKGAGIYQVKLDGVPMLVGLKDLKEWMTSTAYNGKTVGRIAGRLPATGLTYEGKTYPLNNNEGPNTLHGGKDGFSFRKFKMDLHHLESSINVDFYLNSPDMDQGFPNEVTLRVRYIIPEEENIVRIEYKAMSDGNTPVSLTNHAYFNLGGESDILSDTLYVDADMILSYAPDLLPKGYVDIPEFLDCNNGKELDGIVKNPYLSPSKGLDTAFHRENRDIEKPHITLENEKYKLIIKSSYDDVVIYSSNYPPFGMELNNGNIHELHDGLAIEPQYEANDFGRMTVKKGDAQRNFIEYSFIAKEGEGK